MEQITRTVYGSYLQTCLATRIPPVYPASSTLNEKFNCQSGVLPASGIMPGVAFYAIGNKGHRVVAGSDGIAKPEPIQHQATDAALFGHIPFVLRPINNDLSTGERAKYAMRVQETHGGQAYYAYYLRRLDLSNTTPVMTQKVVTNGVTVSTPFVPNSSNLNPEPAVLNNSGSNTVDGSYVVATARVDLTISAAETLELLSVGTILFGDENAAIISEIALCMGVDKNVNYNSGSGTISFLEAIAVQVASHVPAFFPMKFSNQGVTLSLDIGATEPLFGLQG